MNPTSNRWEQWMEPRYREMLEQPSVEIIESTPPRPRYILWVNGGRALVDGEMLALTEVEEYLIYTGKCLRLQLHFQNDDCLNSFNLAVESPEMAIAIAKRITQSSMLRLVELEDDGEYREWYDDEGRDIEALSEEGERRD